MQLNEVDNFKYLGALVRDSKGEIMKGIGMAWDGCNKMTAVWKSGLNGIERPNYTSSNHLLYRISCNKVWLRYMDSHEGNWI